jgi:hypothetical protein
MNIPPRIFRFNYKLNCRLRPEHFLERAGQNCDAELAEAASIDSTKFQSLTF